MKSGRIEVVDTNKLESCLSYWQKDYQNYETEAWSYSLGEWKWPAGVTDQTAWIVVCAACSPAIQVNQTCIERRQSVSFTVLSNKEQEWGGWKPLFIWSEPISSDKRNCNWHRRRRARLGVCIMAAHSNRWLLRGKWVAGRSVRCCFPVFWKELTVSFALDLGWFSFSLQVDLSFAQKKRIFAFIPLTILSVRAWCTMATVTGFPSEAS